MNSNPLRSPVVATLLAALLLGFAQGAWALPSGFGTTCSISGSTVAQQGNPGLLTGDVQTFSGACDSGNAASHGRVDVPVQTKDGQNLYPFTQNAVSSATATGNLGSLGVYANAQADSTPASYLYTAPDDSTGIEENLYTVDGRASAMSSWHDTITVGGTTNANGFVVLKFSMELHGITSVSLADSATATIASRFFINDFAQNNGQLLGLFEPGATADTIGFRPGQEIQLYGDVTATATALAGQKYVCGGFQCSSQVAVGYYPNSNAVADAANTAGFHVDIMTPGGTYSSLSGQNYVTTPVPGAAWLFGSALGLLGLRRRL